MMNDNFNFEEWLNKMSVKKQNSKKDNMNVEELLIAKLYLSVLAMAIKNEVRNYDGNTEKILNYLTDKFKKVEEEIDKDLMNVITSDDSDDEKGFGGII